MKLNINQTPGSLKWPQIIKKSFDFKNGQGLTQLNLSHLFTAKDCQNIYQKFNSNLNWIIRDGQKIEIPKNQVSTAKYLAKFMDFFRQLLQKNIPEKDHVQLKIETLRVARSDGTQHQVGSRWHQDHESYFTLLINLTDAGWIKEAEYREPNSSTNFYYLEPNEKYSLDSLGNPISQKHWKKDYLKPLHLGIINSGLRYFFFPFDKCRPISHLSPQIKNFNKRLVAIATFSVSGIEQGMDLKDLYIPLSKLKNSTALKNLRHHWRNILGIEKSIHTKNFLRRSSSKFGLYKIDSIKFNALNKRSNKKQKKYSQYRIVNFGLKQFQSDLSNNKKLLYKTIPIGELSRSLNFFSKIGEFSIKKLIKTDKTLLSSKDCSLSGNNNYDLLVLFKQPKKALQLLSMEETLSHIEEFVLILYRKANNYIFSKKKSSCYDRYLPFERKKIDNTLDFTKKELSENKIAQMFTSFQFNYSPDIKKRFLISQSLKMAWKKGIKQIVTNEKNKYFLIDKSNFDNKNIVSNQNLRSIDKVPFFLPRIGMNRTLPKVDVSSRLIKLSKKILNKDYNWYQIKKEIAEKATSEEIKTISEFINMELKLSQHITY